MRRFRLTPPTLARALNAAWLGLILAVFAAALYRYCWLDARDPFRCGALLNQGRWLDPPRTPRSKAPSLHWQPPGCLLHEYTGKDISACLRSQRILYVGDSTTRQVYWATVKKIDPDAVRREMGEADKHSDLNFAGAGTTVQFVWDPYLNSTRLRDELAAYRHHSAGDAARRARPGESAALILIGGGLWYARHALVNPLKSFKDAVDSIVPYMSAAPPAAVTSAAGTPFGSDDPSNFLILAPVQVPRYESLTPERQARITPSLIDTMNDYLQQLSANQGADIAWSYSLMTWDRKSAYEESGLHVVESVAAKKADVLLNLRCNAPATGYPHDRTCCSNYRRPGWLQSSILLGGACVLPVLYLVSGKGVPRRFGREEAKPTGLMPSSRLLHALLVFTSSICLCFYADRTQFFNKTHKLYVFDEFAAFCGLVSVLGLLSIRRSVGSARSSLGPRAQDSLPDQPFLSRDQTDEWKGWMQFVILLYHYTGASRVLWIYQIVRLLVASYLFMTGFGHTLFFYQKGDYSMRRVAAVLVRLNLLSCVLPYMMRTDYLSYYFASLVSFWFLVVYLTMRIGRSGHGSLSFVMAKILLSGLVVALLTKTTGPLEALFALLGYTCGIQWNVDEWRFRVGLDMYIVYAGMMLGVLYARFVSSGAHQLDPASRLLHEQPKVARLALIAGSLVTIPAFLLLARRFPDKYDYNRWHPCISVLPILSFVVLRNAHRHLRNFHSTVFAWLGRCSLETFTLQFHIWMAGDTKGLLSLGVLSRDGSQVGRWVEFAVLTAVFLRVSWCVADASSTITAWIVDGDKPKTMVAERPAIELQRVGHEGAQNGGAVTSAARPAEWSRPLQMLKRSLGARLGLVLVVMWTLNVFRTNFTLDPNTGAYTTPILSPTGLPADVPLTSHGVEQAGELAAHVATLDPPPERVYSSPWYRCLQTIAPAVPLLRAATREDIRIRPEPGIGEWYGAASFQHPAPAPVSALAPLFPGLLDQDYTAVLDAPPERSGESIDGLHDRVAAALSAIVASLDAEPGAPRAVLLCTHAATLIAAGRALTGTMPSRVEEADFRPFTAGLSVFVRKPLTPAPEDGGEKGQWRGKGVKGGWTCVRNGDCSFLAGGEERGWAFGDP
ncbi:MAG: hypothetical protein M1832_005041 [Thelocarpon impressellum]|nr:MAG: hypothetical protein M1832_005041 [Thelocarpon impressellum]